MKKSISKIVDGFTIIEISLFLAISSFLAVGLMAGWTTNINRQRYTDMVSTFKSDIQQVFTEVENPHNSMTQRVRCIDGGINISIVLDDGGDARGTTNCIILGRMISFGSPDSAGLFSTHYDTSRYIVGLDIDTSVACGGPCANDLEALKATKFVVAVGSNALDTTFADTNKWEEQRLEWDGRYKMITDNRSSGARAFSGNLTSPWAISDTVFGVMILRSPMSGSVMTFGVPVDVIYPGLGYYNNESNIRDFRNSFVDGRLAISSNKKVDVCIMPSESNGPSIFGRGRVVRIGNTAASVEIAPLEGIGSISCDDQTGFNGVQRL